MVKAPEMVRAPQVKTVKKVLLPAEESALIVVDMQNDFARKGGALYVESAEKVIPAIAKLLKKAREARATVIFTQDWHSPDDPEFKIWGPHAVRDTDGARIVSELQPRAEEKVVQKVRYDAFYGTDLDHYLRLKGIKNVVVTGTVSNICVLHTAGSAALRWYRVIVPVDALAALTEFDQISALRQMDFLYRATLTVTRGLSFQ